MAQIGAFGARMEALLSVVFFEHFRLAYRMFSSFACNSLQVLIERLQPFQLELASCVKAVEMQHQTDELQ